MGNVNVTPAHTLSLSSLIKESDHKNDVPYLCLEFVMLHSNCVFSTDEDQNRSVIYQPQAYTVLHVPPIFVKITSLVIFVGL